MATVWSTPSTLTLTDHSFWWTAGALALALYCLWIGLFSEGSVLALAFTPMCAYAATKVWEKVHISFNAESAIVSGSRQRFRSKERFEFPLPSLTSLVIESTRGGNGLAFRLCLETTDRRIPVRLAFEIGDQSRKAGVALQAWLHEKGLDVPLREETYKGRPSSMN
jgi:hypothetical protein